MGGVTLMTAGSPRPAPDCAKLPRDRRAYHERQVDGIDGSLILSLTDEDLLILRDKVQKEIDDRSANAVRLPSDVRKTILIVSEEAGVSPLDVLSRRKLSVIADARMRAMASVYALRRPGGERRFSSKRIGRMFRRDHKTVLYAVANTPSDRLVKP